MAEKKSQDTPNTNPKIKKPKFNFYWIYGILALTFIFLQIMSWDSGSEKVNWGDLKTMISDGDVERIVLVNREQAEIYIKKDQLSRPKYENVRGGSFGAAKAQYYYMITSPDKFEEKIAEVQANKPNPIYIENETRKNWGGEILGWIFPILILIGAWFFIMRMMSKNSGGAGGQIFNIGKSKAQLFDKSTSVSLNFNDVAGLEEAKVEVMEIVDFLKNPTKYTTLGGKYLKGLYL